MHRVASVWLTDYIFVLTSGWAGVPNKVATECILSSNKFLNSAVQLTKHTQLSSNASIHHSCVPGYFREDLGFRLISEQVSHHPPVSAFHAEGLKQDFVFHGSIYPKLKFWGKSVEAEPKGTITLELPK